MTSQHKNIQDNIITCKPILVNTRQDKKQYDTRQDNTTQYKTRQHKTILDNTRHYKTRQDDTIQDNTT